MRSKFYVGRKPNQIGKDVFKSDVTPTKQMYPQYVSVVGPFRTKRAAIMLAVFGQGNPHMQTVSDAERIAKQEAIKS